MPLSELIFGQSEWSAVLFGIELAVFIGVITTFAMYPVVFFAKQVRSVTR